MNKEQANMLIDTWTGLDLAIKKIETASVQNLGDRVDTLLNKRAEFDNVVMTITVESYKSPRGRQVMVDKMFNRLEEENAPATDQLKFARVVAGSSDEVVADIYDNFWRTRV